MRNVRILFADDEPNLVLTMPHILRQQGYQVTVADTVEDAIARIGDTHFDVLISDLHIGQQDDGIAVISAMRRTQPDSLILILTGYPGFDTAVEAMRNQVDEYLIKPVPLPSLLTLIEQKLLRRHRESAGTRISQVLGKSLFDLMQRLLRAMHEDVRLHALPLSDDQRIEYTSQMVEYMAEMLEAEDPHQIEQTILRQAELQGVRRYQHGYTVPMLAAYARHLERAILDVVHDHISELDPAQLLFDIKRLQSSLGLQLEHTIQAYLEAAERGGEMPAHRPSA